MALSEEKLCSVGCKWMYTFNCLEAKKFIPDYIITRGCGTRFQTGACSAGTDHTHP